MKLSLLITSLSSLVILALSCKVVDPEVNVILAENLKLANNDVSGWNIAGVNYTPNGYLYISGQANLEGAIDGGAEEYIEHGMTNGIIQEMSTSNNQSFIGWIFDYQNASNATSMYNYKKDVYYSDGVENLPDTVAFSSEILGGSKVFGHYLNFYFELIVTGYTDNLQARTTATLFLNTYFQKVQTLSN